MSTATGNASDGMVNAAGSGQVEKVSGVSNAAVTGQQPSPPIGQPPRSVAREPKKSRAAKMWSFFFVIKMLLYLYWNLPGFLNIYSAMRLRRAKRCRVVGYESKFIYAYPLIPGGITLALLSMAGVSSFVTSVAYSVMLIAMLIVMGEDIRGRALWAVGGFITAFAAICFALVWTGVAVGRHILDILHFFSPMVNAGFCFLIAAVLTPLMCLAYVRSRLNCFMGIQGNLFISNTLESKTDFPVADWRLRSVIVDLLEAIWMGARELKLVANAGLGTRGRAGEVDDGAGSRAEYHLPNVPGAGTIEELILDAIEAMDVDASKPRND